jgi:hypothetical protein
MGLEIDFRSFDAFKTSVRDALPQAALSEGQLEALREVVARDDVTIHSINRSKLSDADKAVAALLMLLRDSPGDAKLSRISSNMAEFFDRVVADKARTFSASLRADALGSNPFATWGPIRAQQFQTEGFSLTDSKSGHSIKVTQTPEGEIDVAQAKTWTPEALETAVDQLKEMSAPSENALMQRFKDQLDRIEARVIQRAQEALTQVRDEKVRVLTAGAKAVSHAVAHPKKLDYEVPQANIDLIGHALAAAVDNPPPDDALEALTASLPAFKAKIVAGLAQLSDSDSSMLVNAMQRLSELGDRQISNEVARRAGVSHTALALLTLFRAVEASLETPAVHETVRNLGSIREAAEALLKTSALDGALQGLLKELNDPDPLGLHRGAHLLSSNAFNRQTPIQGVHAIEGEGGVTGYRIATGVGTWTLNEQGIITPESREARPLDELSIDSLRTLATVLLNAAPESVAGPLAYFRKTEERNQGGFSYAKLVENVSTVLAEKMTDRLSSIRDVVLALASLDAIRDRP